jgi:hypothetical protein
MIFPKKAEHGRVEKALNEVEGNCHAPQGGTTLAAKQQLPERHETEEESGP